MSMKVDMMIGHKQGGETMEGTTYQIKDLRTKTWVSKVYAWKDRKRARARANKLDLEYGAHRYVAVAQFV